MHRVSWQNSGYVDVTLQIQQFTFCDTHPAKTESRYSILIRIRKRQQVEQRQQVEMATDQKVADRLFRELAAFAPEGLLELLYGDLPTLVRCKVREGFTRQWMKCHAPCMSRLP